MIIYISGKITGCDDYKERFAAAETYLRGQGHMTINPARIDLGKDATWKQYMKLDLYLLGLCDAIYMLDNWIESRGARIEWMFAKTKGLKIVEEKLKAGGENEDLISRSELLESFEKSYCGHLGMENSDGMMTFRSICRIIKEQPTAYSVDKVVEELKEKENEAVLKAPNTSDITNQEYQKWMMKSYGFKEAIEIVKQGGVSDDECEWEIDGVYLLAPHNNKPFVSCVTDEGYRYNYCPICGKKIKAVE